jgi:hypothetical protein
MKDDRAKPSCAVDPSLAVLPSHDNPVFSIVRLRGDTSVPHF